MQIIYGTLQVQTAAVQKRKKKFVLSAQIQFRQEQVLFSVTDKKPA